MAKESDMVLAIDDALAGKRSQIPKKSSWKDKLRGLIRNKWTWAGVGVIVCLLLAVPYTRYRLLGIVIKKEVGVSVIDSQTQTPISNAVVSIGGVHGKTDANGLAELKVGVGEQNLTITKQYYRTTDSHHFVGFKASAPLIIKLIATGRLVPITVLNTISGKPLSGASIHILDTTAKTNANGQATVAIPAGTGTDSATISLNGYNTKQVNVQVTASVVPANSFNLTPYGSVYFLATQSGTINVVKSNLDGSNLQTVLAGTGHESPSTTRLLVSNDWRYLVLEANRAGTQPALYLIDTSNNQVTEFDTSNATFNLIGWYGHNFLYSLTSSSDSQSQSGAQIVKEYNADQRQLNQIDQNQAASSGSSYAYQNFADFYIAGNELVYDTQWSSVGGYDISSDNDTIRVFELNSQSKTDAESFPANTTQSIQAVRYQPAAIYFAVVSTTSGATSYYQYANQTVQAVNISQATFSQTYPTYLVSPSGSHSVWTTLSNGQDIFFTGDSNGGSQQQIAAIDNFKPYGWYSDNYILASRDNDQLYILPASSISGSQQPLKIGTYYEPNTNSTYEYGGF
jgi:hypothetical protein